MYGEDDLSSSPLFSGNFINFGYWKDFTPGRYISIDERTESQADLYRMVLDRLNIAPADVVLEVGCGIGVGTALALREYNPRTIHGLDLSQDQINRAMRVNGELVAEQRERFFFCRGSALALPYADEKFDKCYSLEAAQHFEDLARFAAEAYRVLQPSGGLAVATFFLPLKAVMENLRRLIKTVESGIDVVVPIDSFRGHLLEVGFDNVRVETVGEGVWRGFDAWMEQTEYMNTWCRNWLKAYNQGLVDYYVVTAQKR